MKFNTFLAGMTFGMILLFIEFMFQGKIAVEFWSIGLLFLGIFGVIINLILDKR